MKLTPTTSLNDCIKRISDGSTSAATLIGLLVKEYPDSAMKWMHILDEQGIYGSDLWDGYRKHCGHNMGTFMEMVSDGVLKELLKADKIKNAD